MAFGPRRRALRETSMNDVRSTAIRVVFAFVSLGPMACGSGSSSSSSGDGGVEAGFIATALTNTDSCPVVVKEADCDQNQRPILFVHGTYSSGMDIAHMASLLGSNG